MANSTRVMQQNRPIGKRQARCVCGKKTDIAELHVTYEEAQKLCNKGIRNIDDLWMAIGKDLDNGITEVADMTGVKRERLIALLSTQAISEAKASEPLWLIRYWLEILLVIIGLTIIVYGVYAIVLAVRALG